MMEKSHKKQPSSDNPVEKINRIIDCVGERILDKKSAIRQVIAALLAGGHVLLEDRPGLGKTTLAASVAQVFGLDYNRIQLTSDMMPSDVLGVSIYQAETQQFSYHKGPIFTQFLLADELNRATPKTQSALLEAMAENQVSMDGKTYPMDEVFFVMATQNPIDDSGTYSLPHSQLDRFLISLSLGYPSEASERQIYSGDYLRAMKQPLPALCDSDELLAWQQTVTQIHAADEVLDYLQWLVTNSRKHPNIQQGLSPRAGLGLFRMAQSQAFMAGRDFITPDDVTQSFYPVCRHRLLTDDGRLADEYIEELLDSADLV
jgi:MoxR-like ATPases